MPNPKLQFMKTAAKHRVKVITEDVRRMRETFVGDGATKTFKVKLPIRSVKSVFVNGREVDHAFYGSSVILKEAPKEGEIVSIHYLGEVEHTAFRYKPLVEGGKMLRWHELFEKIAKYVSDHSLAECKELYERLVGEKYDGVNSKKGVLLAYIKHRFGVDLSDLPTTDILERMKKLAPKLGRWGLGCPYGCGRYWELKPTDDLERFEPVDPAAMTGPQAEILDEWDVVEPDTIIDPETGEEVPNPNAGRKTHYYRIRHWNGDIMVVTKVPVNRGYLDWTPLSDGSIRFVCDKCKGEIILYRS